MDLSTTSKKMKDALVSARVLERPPPARIGTSKLRCLWRIYGLSGLSEVVDDDMVAVATR